MIMMSSPLQMVFFEYDHQQCKNKKNFEQEIYEMFSLHVE